MAPERSGVDGLWRSVTGHAPSPIEGSCGTCVAERGGMNALFRAFSRALLVPAIVLATASATAACSTTPVTVKDVTVARPIPASNKVVLIVDTSVNSERGEAAALEAGLTRELRSAGYVFEKGGLTVHARIVEIHRGSAIANAVGGALAGTDHADVAVAVDDPAGKRLMSFTVRGEALDKRYRQLDQALSENVPVSIREELAKARN